MFFQSDTGDWSEDLDYCFRADGTLARSKATVVNEARGNEGERIVYYAADARVLFASARSVDADGKTRANAEGLGAAPVYPTIKSLPFNAAVGAIPPAPTRLPANKP